MIYSGSRRGGGLQTPRKVWTGFGDTCPLMRAAALAVAICAEAAVMAAYAYALESTKITSCLKSVWVRAQCALSVCRLSAQLHMTQPN